MSIIIGNHSTIQGNGQYIPGPVGDQPNPMSIVAPGPPWDYVLTEVDAYLIGSGAGMPDSVLQGIEAGLGSITGYFTLFATVSETHLAGSGCLLTFGTNPAFGSGPTAPVLISSALDTAGSIQIWGVVTPQAGAPTAPAAPTILAALSLTEWELSYFMPPGGKYIATCGLERSVDGGATWTIVDSHSDVGGAGLNGQVFIAIHDTGVPAGPLQYRCFSNGDGTSYSPVIVMSAPTNAFVAPALLALTMGSWQITFPGGGFSGFAAASFVQRSTDGGTTWVTIATPGIVGAYDDPGAPSGSLQYRWGVANSVGASFSPAGIATVPATPAIPTLTPLTMTSWRVNYTASANGIEYLIERSQDSGSTWSTLHTDNPFTGTYTDTTVAAGALAYRIVPGNSVGLGTQSPTATAPLPGTPPQPTLTENLL